MPPRYNKEYWRNYRKRRPGLYAAYLKRNPEKALEKKERLRVWSTVNKEKRRVSAHRYYALHKTEVNRKNRQYAAANKHRHADQRRAYRERTKLERSIKHKAYYRSRYARDPEFRQQFQIAAIKRRALKAKVTIDETGIKEHMQRVKNADQVACAYCGVVMPGHKVHFDHIVPLSRGGMHAVSNLASSCQTCNLSKHDQLLSEWSRTKDIISTN